ncbi:hypothetical protein IG197_14650 [Aminobacter sp. SR38]|jgi:hypothetical protein|uniref:glycosyltransferase n=1 Tax=Aminobacter sp. SR38 TaxID=2774562 RepID=UPI00177B6077|nr:glycosyltransferase [Aminobacter sp. SR38]QOF69138.1 hypothetical protein IG197_14650 [Aminobacter sp. SR38]
MSTGAATCSAGATLPPQRRALRLPDRFDLAPVDDRNFSACERVGQAIDAVVAGWLASRGYDRLFVTLATPDFAMGLSALVRSLRTVSDVPILVLTQGDFVPDVEADDVAFLEVPPLVRLGHAFPADAQHLAVTLSKLWVFSLTRPARVAFIDADCLVLQPIDDLFDGEGFAAVPDLFINYKTPAFNAGVFAFTPSAEISRGLFQRLPELSVGDGDQGILNAFFPNWRQLPQGLNFLRAHALVRAQAQDQAIRIVHYTPSKPWVPAPVSPRDPVLAPLDDLWTERLTPVEHVALVRDWRARLATAEANIASWMGPDTARFLQDDMDFADGRKRRRRERRLKYGLVALVVLQAVQASFIAWMLLHQTNALK